MKEFRLPVAREAAWMEATISSLDGVHRCGASFQISMKWNYPTLHPPPANISFVNLSINTHAFVRWDWLRNRKTLLTTSRSAVGLVVQPSIVAQHRVSLPSPPRRLALPTILPRNNNRSDWLELSISSAASERWIVRIMMYKSSSNMYITP